MHELVVLELIGKLNNNNDINNNNNNIDTQDLKYGVNTILPAKSLLNLL